MTTRLFSHNPQLRCSTLSAVSLKSLRTPLGGFFNHSKRPNCEAIYDGDYIKLITINNVNFDEELTVDYTKHDWIKKK
mgnify:CR=1 FL=1